MKAPSVRTLMSLMIVALGVHSGPLWGQTPAGPPKSRIEIPFQRYVLPNGLTLIVHEDHKAPIVAVNVWYHVGSKNENRGRTGFAHLFEHILSRKTVSMPYNQVNRLTEDVGGTRNASTGDDRTNYFETVPAQYLETMLWTHAERMARPVVDDEVFEKERSIVKEELRQRILALYAEVTLPARP